MAPPPPPAPDKAKAEACAWIERTVKAGLDGLRREFVAIRKFETPNAAFKAFKSHNVKNRYKDVKCADATRIKLVGSAGDYIHASLVTFGLQHKLILTQAPTDRTLNDFWRMVWQQNVSKIVMLCDMVESNGKFKCPQYWPTEPSKPIITGAYKIVHDRRETIALNDNQEVHKTVLVVTRSAGGNKKLEEADGGGSGPDQIRTIEQYRWIGWPEKGVPHSSASAIYVRQVLRENDQGSGPSVVHCSSGVGRAGTLAVFALACERLEHGIPLQLSELVKQTRAMRMHVVQTEQQYLFVHRCVIEYVTTSPDPATMTAPMTPSAIMFLCDYELYLAKKDESMRSLRG